MPSIKKMWNGLESKDNANLLQETWTCFILAFQALHPADVMNKNNIHFKYRTHALYVGRFRDIDIWCYDSVTTCQKYMSGNNWFWLLTIKRFHTRLSFRYCWYCFTKWWMSHLLFCCIFLIQQKCRFNRLPLLANCLCSCESLLCNVGYVVMLMTITKWTHWILDGLFV